MLLYACNEGRQRHTRRYPTTVVFVIISFTNVPLTRTTSATVCALCLRPEPIVTSHLLPAGVYRLLRDNERRNPNPVIVGETTSTQTADQVAAPLLCWDCEEHFNNRGERWVLQNCFRGPGEFKMLDALRAAKPLHPLDEGAVYAGAQIADIDMDSLVYFASSVIWRAAARTWGYWGSREQLSLGPYFEDFRLYLLNPWSFPVSAAVWVNVWPVPVMLSVLPRTLRGQGYRHHNFSIPGITFHVFVGQRLPLGLLLACAARSSDRMVFLSNDMNAALLQGIARKVLGSRPTGSLREK